MALVLLGTFPALDSGRLLEGRKITTWQTWDGIYSTQELMRTISHPEEGFWPRHSPNPPLWVESEDQELAEAISAHYGCPIGRPDYWPAD